MNDGFFAYVILIISGIGAGFINTLSGGGSALSLPVLVLMGLPAPVANATNRVAILLQNLVGTSAFYREGELKIKPIFHILIPAVCGGIVGSFTAVNLNSEVFETVLGIVFLFMIVQLFLPKKIKKEERKTPRWLESLLFLFVGFYGGAIQVGVGLLFLIILNRFSNINLVKSNAIKVSIVLGYTIPVVVIFAVNNLIIWKYGLILAAGNMTGAYLGVKTAVKGGEKIIKGILLFAMIFASLKLFGILNI